MKEFIINFEVLMAYILIATLALLIKPFSLFKKSKVKVKKIEHLDKASIKS